MIGIASKDPMVDEPNVILPLATSINERGVAGYTHSVTNSEDQRKLNCIYELVNNHVTGKGTLSLSKRPGVTNAQFNYGAISAGTAYMILDLNLGADTSAIFYKDGNDNKSVANGSRVILNASTYFPGFCDMTAISNVPNAVVQLISTVGAAQKVYFASNSDVNAGNAWTQMSASSATSATGGFTVLFPRGKMEHMDGFAFTLNRDNKIFNSDSNSLSEWQAASFLAKQIKQDLPVGLARLSNKLLAFGQETVEGFYNAGNTVGSPLGRIPQLHSRIGLVPMSEAPQSSPGAGGTHYYCTISNNLYFIGRYSNGVNCGLFAFNGSEFGKVSSSYVDKILSERVSAGTVYSVSALMINGQSMVSISFSLPGVSPHIALLYSTEWKEWFELNSTVFSSVNNGKFHLGVGTKQTSIYSFDSSDNWQDDGTSYQFMTQFRLPTNGSSRKFMPMYGIDADTDSGGLASTLTVEASDDDCVSFSTLGTLDLTKDRKMLFRGGSFRKRFMRLSNINSRPTRIHNFLARVS